MQGTFAGIADQIEAEMDLTSEAANVRLGAVYDGKGNPYVQSMKLSDAAPAKTNYMMIQKAPGSTAAHYLEHLSRHSDRTPIHPMVLANRMGAMMNDLAEKWVEEAIFGSASTLKGSIGDSLHAVLCAAGFNIRWLLRMIAKKGICLFLRLLQASGLGHIGRHLREIFIDKSTKSSAMRLALA
jgi:hypothetical protein